MQDIKVAIVGTGFMGWVHAEALKRVGVHVVGICGSTEAKSKAAAKQFGIARAYGAFEEVLADSEVHSVHIGTPNRWHFEMAKQCLLSGKHVMCEKPLAMTAAESAELVEVAKQCPDLAAGVNYNIRFYPLCLEARHLARSNQIGKVVHVTGSYVQDWLTKGTDYNWRVLADQGGELRAVSDIGTHWLDLVQSITGKHVASVFADLMTVHPTRQRPKGEVETFTNKSQAEVETESVEVTTEDYGAILLRFEDGTRGCVHVSQVTPGRKNCIRFEIAGSKQSLAWDGERPNELWIGNRDRSNETLMRDPALLSGVASQRAAVYPGGHNEGYSDSFKQCFRSFYEYIAKGDFDAEPTFPTFADGHREIVLCEAILRSHREQCWVSVGANGD